MSSRVDWNRSPESGWGLFKIYKRQGVSRHTKVSDPDKKIDRSPKTRRWSPGEKEKLLAKLEKREFTKGI